MASAPPRQPVAPTADPAHHRPAPPEHVSAAAGGPLDGASGGEPVIVTEGLRKVHGKVVSLRGLTAAVPPGPVGLLGANGAGKTTLIRLLLGLSAPTAGSARVLGLDARRDAIRVRQRVGYMPESDVLPTGATAADFVAHMAEMSGLPTRAARQRAADVLYQVGLDEERYRLIKGFSTGMKQRVKLAQAIVHDPRLVFLDEPTNGMDPQGRDEMLALVRRISRQMGISIVMSSHILEDIERTCDHVVILDRGRLVANQSIRGLDRQVGGELTLRIDGDPAAFGAVLAREGLTVGRAERASVWDELTVRHDDDRTFDVIRDAAVATDTVIRSLRERSRSLEDVYFSRVAEADAADAGASEGGANG